MAEPAVYETFGQFFVTIVLNVHNFERKNVLLKMWARLVP